MSKVDESEYKFVDALKPADLKGKVEAKIKEVKEVKTKYGSKRLLVLESGKQVFLNAMSLQNLVEVGGDETNDWVGNEIIMDIENSKRTQEKDAIVVTPKK